MSNGLNDKDWLDALREKSLSEGAAPSPASWEAVGRRVRRAAALRRAGVSAAALVSVAAILLWAPWHRPAQSVPTGTAVAQVNVVPESTAAPGQAVEDEVPVIPGETNGTNPPKPSHRRVLSSSGQQPAASVPAPSADPAGSGDGVAPDAAPSQGPAGAVDAAAPAQPVPAETVPAPTRSTVAPGEAPFDPFLLAAASTPRQRPRVSVGVRVGSGMARRAEEVQMHDYPMLLAANYLNSFDPLWVSNRLKSNGYYTNSVLDGVNGVNGLNKLNNYWNSLSDAQDFYADTRVSRYHHDLPLTLGLSVRLALTPRIGLESGLDYTYLRSVEEVEDERLEQRLHFVGIPLRADARIWSRGGFDIYAGLGVEAEKCISATLGLIPCSEPRLQWSAETFAGLQYRLGSRTRLYFQPELSYYFTRTELVTCRTEHPLTVSLHAGLRFEL